MRCYYVLVHGSLKWLANGSSVGESEIPNPAGFYCHRYVLAADEAGAITTAFQRVQTNLDITTNWFSDGLATMELEAEKVTVASLHKLLKRDNRGHTFYTQR